MEETDGRVRAWSELSSSATLESPLFMSATVHIRSAESDDAPALFDVHTAAIRALDGYSDKVKTRWLQLLSPEGYGDPWPDDFRAVAEVDGKVVAFGEVDLRKGVIVALYVHPTLAREGVGTALLDELEAKAKLAGLSTLEVLSGLNAEGFYVHHGYKVVGMAKKRVTTLFTVEGVQMEKKL